ncbi:MAG TPA: hypothetical protein VMU10_08955 [Desulfomonilia bacterium]|nr:hypothetical protein [Desulfomonilia bacterium]
MRKLTICLPVLVSFLCISCAIMKDLDGAYSDKELQGNIKELGSYIDTLKSQNEERYTYKILTMNAREMVNVSGILSRKAPDSYFRRMVNRLSVQAEELYLAASHSNVESTKASIENILGTWEIIQEYKKPS